MSIRPIEILMMPNKSQEVSLIHNAENQRLASANAHIGVHYNNEVKHNMEQTVKTQKSENHEYRYDAKEKGNGTYSNKQKRQGKKEKAKKSDPIKQGSFDIRI